MPVADPIRYPPAVGLGQNLLRRMGFIPIPITTRIADLQPGPVHVFGNLRSKDRLKSPIQDKWCIGYWYKSSHRVTQMQGGYRRLPLVKVLVYPKTLELELLDGRISLVPRDEDEFSAQAHQRLAEHGYDGFKAFEGRLWRGREATAQGIARRNGDKWVVTFTNMTFEDKPNGKADDGRTA